MGGLRGVFVSVLVGGSLACGACTRPDFKGKIHLSFDDGANPDVTMSVLETLDRYHVSPSFFEVGNHLASLPDRGRGLLAAKRARGHIVGNHSFTHPKLTELSREEIEKELRDTEDLLQDFMALRLVRPPYGDDDDRVRGILRDLGYLEVMWHVQAAEYDGWDRDYVNGVEGTRERFIENLVGKVKKKNGGIVLEPISKLPLESVGHRPDGRNPHK